MGRARSARRMARQPVCPHPSPSGQAQRAWRSGGPHGSAVQAGLPHPRERGREHNTIDLHSSSERDMTRHTALLRLIPPPPRWRPLLRLAPTSLRERLMARALSHALAPEHIGSALDDIAWRRLGIEVSDLGLHCVLRWRGGRVHAVQAPPAATARGTAPDLMLLAARQEDRDTLYCQRRLVLTGDPERGLTVRNLLDRMPWEALPLGLRIVLYRDPRLAR